MYQIDKWTLQVSTIHQKANGDGVLPLGGPEEHKPAIEAFL